MEKEKILNTKFIIISIICIILFVIAIVPKELQNDTFYTIKLGELILNNGIDMQEHFAWHEGLIYTYPHWLYDIGIYLIYFISGFNGIYISSIIIGIVLGITIYLTNAKLTKNTVIPFFTTILVLYLGKDFITARAQLITFVLFVLTIYYIERFLETQKIRFSIGLIIIPILIANIHAAVFPFYFILYLPYLAEFLMPALCGEKGDLITKLFLKSDKIEIEKLKRKIELTGKQKDKLAILINRVEKNEQKIENNKNNIKEPYKFIIKENRATIKLIGIMLLAFSVGTITPIGDTPYTYLINTMKGNTTQNISEHLPIVLYNSKYILGYMVLAIALIGFTKVKIKLSDFLLLSGLILLTIMSRRQQSLLLFIGILVINKLLCQLIQMYDKNGTMEILKYFTSIIGRIIIYSVFAIYMVFQIKDKRNIEVVSNESYPIEATRFVKENLDLRTKKLYNEYNFGSYMLFEDVPVFIDSRADVYDPEFNGLKDDIFRDFINIDNANANYEEKLDYYGITHLLIYNDTTLAKLLKKDSNYIELYKDSKFIIYEKVSSK